ncbi:tRNA1(Val) (adenine(37)-N6)-methyltransferase [Flavobacterium sp.]|uniref:tRNA1(Val) (adenine(37)-N6)-methyltransferase n=1 Tax=Flavobacterium sp. TaxID=239 RepID=UPI003D0C7462
MSFQFKQFSIQQEKTAMKVGTDGVLLGAWTPIINNPFNILDIGAGTGLIALMLAQRTQAEQIDAIEIDENAYEECVDNFENSPWNDRLYCYHAGLDEFVDEVEELYDLIVSNPPFYTAEYKSNNESRDLARFEDALPFEELVEAADFFLSDHGIFSIIIPFSEEEKILSLCLERELFPIKITRVKGTPASEIKRSLMAFTRIQQEPIINELIIEIARHDYTDEYKELTKDFYLKM